MTIFRIFIIIVFFNKTKEELFMVNDPITKIMRNASEIVRYDEVGIPLSIREGLLSAYPNHRALCHWHEDIEWVYIRSGQMNYYMNGKRVLLNTGEALMVNSRQMHYGYSENGQDCDFIRILCHPKIFITNSVLYQSYIAPVLSNPSLEYLHLKPEFPEDAEALQLLPEILRIKKEHPAAYEIEAAALLSLLWCRLLRSHPMMPNEAAAKPKEPDLLVQRDMVSYIYSHYSESINLDEIAAAGKVCRNKCCQIFRRYLNQSPIDFLNHYRLEVSCHLLNNTKLSIAEICTACGFNHQSYYSKIFLRTYSCSPRDFRKRTEEKTSAEASEKD
jgi:AraC-like DNA-binding protein